MVKTPIALYRQGNATSPRMDNVRLGLDNDFDEQDGKILVYPTTAQGELPGGISTWSYPGRGKNWWKLDVGIKIPELLELVNDDDDGDHWLWKPKRKMTLEEYKISLKFIGNYFYKIN